MKNNNSIHDDINDLNDVADDIRDVKKKSEEKSDEQSELTSFDSGTKGNGEQTSEDLVPPVYEATPDCFDKSNSDVKAKSTCAALYDFVEMIAVITIAIILCFSFLFRLNVVSGPSMQDTLHGGEYLIVSDLFYKPCAGDIVVLQDLNAGNEDYRKPLVKRIIATEGQEVDIDFDTGILTVDGEIVDESSYINLEGSYRIKADYDFPITIDEGCVFVMGDNRNNSADSRRIAIGQIDERNIVGKVYARVFPFNKFKIFSNPYSN